MTAEETVKEQVCGKFPFMAEKFRIARARRIFADVSQENFKTVFGYLIGEAKFCMLCTMTGLDEGASLGVTYHLAQESGIVFNLHTSVPKDNPVLQTVSDKFPAAECYERELIDLLGFDVRGLPPGHRYPLTDDWPKGNYPLRKDWTQRSDKKVEVKRG